MLHCEGILRAVLAAKGIKKSYDSCCALTDASIELPAGSITGLIGPNGAGKSTLLRILAGLDKPDSGEILFSSSKPDRNKIGMAPQEIALYPTLTGMENIWFFGRLFGQSHHHCAALLETVGLKPKANARVSTYSGGMQRRLNLAVSLVGNPDVLLLDEPMAGVDPTSRQALRVFLRSLADKGLAILLATHLLEDAARLCDRVAVIRDGYVSGTVSPEHQPLESVFSEPPEALPRAG